MSVLVLAAIEVPHGPAFRFFVVAAVVVGAPVIAARVRIPGMVGLLLGGMIVGPYVLGWITTADTDVSSLGQIGLLYLMFVAGLELDLNLFRRHRNAAIGFALLTFGFPMLFGWASATVLGFSLGASLLLGSLWASHTLVTYPQVRDLGLARDRSVAATVGATVITDTLALIVLAVVAGTAGGAESGSRIVGELVIGFAALVIVGFVLLPRFVRFAFRTFATERAVRYMVAMGSFLGIAMLGEVFGIEPIVGAFFAGLALNRLIPNSGLLMERIEFFGTALFIPAFLVSVGLLINPSVMVEPETLGLAAVFALACIAGKAVAAGCARVLYGYSSDQAGLVLSLSVAQAAATLAAAFVGLQVGLLSERVVNATLVVVVVTLVLAPALASVFGRRVPVPEEEAGAIGRAVVVGVGRSSTLPGLGRCAAALAAADGGVVIPMRVVTPTEQVTGDTQRRREEADRAIAGEGIDAAVATRVDETVADGLVRGANTENASLLVVGWDPIENDGLRAALERPVSDLRTPVVFVAGAPDPIRRVVVVVDDRDLDHEQRVVLSTTAEVARRLGNGHVSVYAAGARMGRLVRRLLPTVATHDLPRRDLEAVRGELREGDLVLLPASRSWAALDRETASLAQEFGVALVARPQASGIALGGASGLWERDGGVN